MRQWIKTGVMAGLAIFSASAHADVVAGCNYSFPVGPYEDRGSVQVLKLPAGLSMQFVEDDQVVRLDHIVASSASGDQAREMIGKENDFKVYVSEARIFADEIDHVDGYVAPASSAGGQPQARFFVFYGKDHRYLGGFGSHGKAPFVCDWVDMK